MTPLAHKIIRELSAPIKDRRFNDIANVRPRMTDLHCFEVSKVSTLARELAKGLCKTGVPDIAGFLPAPRTWLEFSDADGRIGLFLEEIDGGGACTVDICGEYAAGRAFGSNKAFKLNLKTDRSTVLVDKSQPGANANFAMVIFSYLAMINSPRVIGRKQHTPHSGLQRQLLKTKGLLGRFPLHAWTEMELVAFAHSVDAVGDVHQARYTGDKCLHFCRAHVRFQNGKLVVVQSHWRGNPALGIKRTRYKILPPRPQTPSGQTA